MLSQAADQVGRGWAFGVHEALDQTGGMLGPLLVAAMLFFNKGYKASFAVLAIPASLALVVLIITWRLFPETDDIHRKPVELSREGLPEILLGSRRRCRLSGGGLYRFCLDGISL